MNAGVALATPPVGMCLYVITAISRRRVSEAIQGSLPFTVLLLALLALLALLLTLLLLGMM